MRNPDRALIALGKNIRRRRTALKLSQQRLAATAHLDRSYLSDIERGTRNLSLFCVVRIAKALGTTVGVLFRDIDR
jgi:transcriptional regulator with XRE-family HTH domain